VHRVTERAGKSDKKMFIVPVYRLSGLESWYYERELKPALYLERLRKKLRKRRSERLKQAAAKRRARRKKKSQVAS
jgi:hypothetical protein